MTESEEYKLAVKIQDSALEAKRLAHEALVLQHSTTEQALRDQVTAMNFHQSRSKEVIIQLIDQLKRTKHCVVTVDWRNEIEAVLSEASKLV